MTASGRKSIGDVWMAAAKTASSRNVVGGGDSDEPTSTTRPSIAGGVGGRPSLGSAPGRLSSGATSRPSWKKPAAGGGGGGAGAVHIPGAGTGGLKSTGSSFRKWGSTAQGVAPTISTSSQHSTASGSGSGAKSRPSFLAGGTTPSSGGKDSSVVSPSLVLRKSGAAGGMGKKAHSIKKIWPPPKPEDVQEENKEPEKTNGPNWLANLKKTKPKVPPMTEKPAKSVPSWMKKAKEITGEGKSKTALTPSKSSVSPAKPLGGSKWSPNKVSNVAVPGRRPPSPEPPAAASTDKEAVEEEVVEEVVEEEVVEEEVAEGDVAVDTKGELVEEEVVQVEEVVEEEITERTVEEEDVEEAPPATPKADSDDKPKVGDEREEKEKTNFDALKKPDELPFYSPLRKPQKLKIKAPGGKTPSSDDLQAGKKNLVAAPKGSVKERINKFASSLFKKKREPEILYKGDPAKLKKRNQEILLAAIKIQAVVRRIQANHDSHIAKMLKEKRAKRQKGNNAATKIQSATRTKQAKKRMEEMRETKKRGIQEEAEPEDAIVEVKEPELPKPNTSEKDEEERKRREAAAVKLQAFVRSGLTRVKVLAILEELIAELEGQDLQNMPNGAVGKRIEAMNEKKRESMLLVAGDPKAFAKRQEDKKHASIKIQCMVREQQARALKKKLAFADEEKARRLKEKEEAARIQPERGEAARNEAEERARLEKEKPDRKAKEKAQAQLLAFEAKAKADAEAAALAKSKFDIEETAKREAAATKIEACMRSALSRMKVCKMVDAMISALLQEQDERVRIAQEALDAAKCRDREAEITAEATLRKQRELEEADAIQGQKDIDDATLGKMLFCGPLPFDMELLPQWWMDNVPHNTGYIDGYESPEFHQWRMEQIETYGTATAVAAEAE